MKKYLSVFALIAQNSIYRILGVLALLTAADAALAWYHLVYRGYGIENLFFSGGIGIVLLITFILMAFVLLRYGDIYRGTQSYTMLRLGISERAVFGLQILYCTFCWFILWGVQLAIAFAVCKIYFAIPAVSADPLNSQHIFLLFYTKPLLHSLLPMEDILAWIANLCMVGALGVTTAYCIAGHKDKERTAQLFSTCVLIGLLFCRELGEFIMNIAIIVCCMLDMAVYTYRGLFPKKKKGGGEYA